jgi:tryptophan halogenase
MSGSDSPRTSSGADPRPFGRVDHVIVLGGGSAGYLAAISLKTRLPALDVLIVKSGALGIIGVGEGTTVSVPNFLHAYLKIDPADFVRRAQVTYKLGIKFLWGPRPYFTYTFGPQFNVRYEGLSRPTGYYCDDDDESVKWSCLNAAMMSSDKAFERRPSGAPGIRNDAGYHIENAHFVAFLEAHAASLGVRVVDDTVEHVEQDERGVTALVCGSGRRLTADLFVDSSGFFSLLLGRTLGEPFIPFDKSLYCDRAVVGGWDRDPATDVIKSYTTAETLRSGWCWRIDHETRVNRGYVYSSAFATDEEAEREYRALNPGVGPTRVVKFVSGRRARGWVKNVVGIGNAFGFVEPLESTSLAMICDQCTCVCSSLTDSGRRPGPGMALAYNLRQAEQWEDIRDFLAVHYRFNTRLETEFWRACRSDVEIGNAAAMVEYYRDNGPSTVWRDSLIGGRDVFGFEGYLAMLVGMKVPYRLRYDAPPDERDKWQAILRSNREAAEKALTMRQTLEIVRRPDWKTAPGFYRYP